MASIDAMIKWMTDREGKYKYDQVRPWSEGKYDCSAAVISALRAGGFLEAGPNEGWTGSLYTTTLPWIAKQISRAECRRGDIFLSNPMALEGHTGIFLGNNTIIHCNYGDRTISTTVADGRMGDSPFYYYRLNAATDPTPTQKGETTMQCFFKSNSSNTVYYFDGKGMTGIAHQHERDMLNDVYKANNGKDMPYFVRDEGWFSRLKDVSKRPIL